MQSLTQVLKSLEGLSDIELFVIDLFCGAGGMSEGIEGIATGENWYNVSQEDKNEYGVNINP